MLKEVTTDRLYTHVICENMKSFVNILREQQDTAFPRLSDSTWKREELLRALLVGFAVWLLRVWLQKFVFSKGFQKYSVRLRRKLSENLYYSIAYCLSFACGLITLTLEDWRVDLRGPLLVELWSPYPPPLSTFFRSYYVVELGYYLGSLVFLLFSDTKHSDFLEFCIHHVATILLIYISYSFRYVRIGLVILVLHDASDILLYSTKCVYYIGFRPLDSIMFTAFAVIFYFTRLFIFPRIIWGVAVDIIRLILRNHSFSGFASNWPVHFSHYFICLFALSTLELLHCFWFSLILKMIGRVIFASFEKLREEGDIRSDDEDSEQ
ncbi:longevity assurance protein LAG1 [Galdieria sulphuraria]|uniref:Longevity assurance protein LAG1 n=1 Tax=Galdieria sulphuraria TaxID=130081 RepID=M2XHL4_GALSU|nr:longevity assurance protein LAG1 [Galdieria sulphuraria]EME29577.1 longevity assurance protein LAG1 [Galdieria sulphuraria]|eukprot:XP_005706097.1 longevity assurance protein LAG1 [Galdieria sulphuraria]